MRKAIFIDKDGTLIKDVAYNVDPAQIQLTDGSTEAICQFRMQGYLIVVISNQSGIAHGYFTEEQLQVAFDSINKKLAHHGGLVDHFYYCPHHPDGLLRAYSKACDCRKPKPGLLLRAARELNIDLNNSWMIGDIINDVEAGHRAGCRSILLDVGNETVWNIRGVRCPFLIASTFKEATNFILSYHTIAVHE